MTFIYLRQADGMQIDVTHSLSAGHSAEPPRRRSSAMQPNALALRSTPAEPSQHSCLEPTQQ